MERNPYTPPVAAVHDPQVAAPPKPPEVTRACRIFWVVFAISLMTLHPAIRGEWWTAFDEGAGSIGMTSGIVLLAVSSIVYAVLIVLVGRRHNWARWVLLGYVLLGSFVLVAEFDRSLSETPFAAVMDVLTTLAESWALCLLFFGAGARWFRWRYAS